MNPYDSWLQKQQAEQAPVAPTPTQQVVQELAPLAVKEGFKYLTAPAAEAATTTALESMLAGGAGAEQLFTPLTPSTWSTPVGNTLASSGAETTLSNFAGAATPVLGALGTAAGAYGAYESIKNKDPLGAGLSGAGAGLGLNALGLALGPAGWAAMIAAPVLGAIANKHLDKQRWKTEGKALGKLAKKGVFIPQNLRDSMPSGPREKSQLIRKDLAADFVGRDAAQNWVNNKFAETRNEADLRPEDIVNYAAFAENDKDWFNKSLDDRLIKAKQALDAQAVREKRGSISVDWNKVAGALANG
jgi:hypothetical protein